MALFGGRTAVRCGTAGQSGRGVGTGKGGGREGAWGVDNGGFV